MDLEFFVVQETLSDDSIVHNVVGRGDEGEQPIPIWRAPSEVAARALVTVLTEVKAEFGKCHSDAEYSALACLYVLAV